MIKRIVFLFFSFFFIAAIYAQDRPVSVKPNAKVKGISNRIGDRALDSLLRNDEFKVELSEQTKHTDYKIISYHNDTTFVDTTLVLKKDFIFNYLRKDNFELLPFHNQGQTSNRLGYDYNSVSLYPKMGATAKHFNFHEVEDINYYHVPTPTTELMYRAGLKQGQVLDALITLNVSKRQNLTFQYKGLRSLGKYRHALASHGNLRLSYTYKSKSERYSMRSHIAAQQILNDESGGLKTSAIALFESNDTNFRDRGRLETNFLDAANVLRANRYYLEQEYDLLPKKDSVSKRNYALKLRHTFNYETKHYQFNQDKANIAFGDAYTTKIQNRTDFKKTYNELGVGLQSNSILGNVAFFIANYNYDVRYKNVIVMDNNQIVPQSIQSNLLSTGAKWQTKINAIKVDVKAATTFIGALKGNYFKATASYKKDSLFVAKASMLQNSKSVNFNYLFNQSDYKKFNWYNTSFKQEHTRSLLFELESDKWVDASAQITQLDNYTYLQLADNDLQPTPHQFAGTINYLKVKASKAIKYKRITLDNTLMYQAVANGASVFKVPTLVSRNSLYYTGNVFKKKPMFLQTGITFKYFSKYFANAYNPVLSEFYLQEDVKIGNYPVIDVFANARVRNMRLFLKAEHVNSFFSKKNYYTAPNYPYRDFVIRFGIVWNFFI